jgi:hypothetical protein
MDTQIGRTRRARLRKEALRRAYHFFRKHAGFRAGFKAADALMLAKAEEIAVSNDWGFAWDCDSQGCIGCTCGSDKCPCFTGEPHEVLVCRVMTADGDTLASLGSICNPSSNYSRVVEAELALEVSHA